MAYTPKTDWKNGDTLPAADINRIEQGIADASISATWDGVTGKPTTYAPIIGTTASTAKAGNWMPAIGDIPTGTTATTVALGNHTHAGLVTATAAPTITISDPADAAAIQEAFGSLVAALKTAGVLT